MCAEFPAMNIRSSMCMVVCDRPFINGVFPPHVQCSLDRLRIHHDPAKDKVSTRAFEWSTRKAFM